MSSPRDYQARSSEMPVDIEPFDDDTKAHARLIAYEHSHDLQECAEFWRMLGIHPDQEEHEFETRLAHHPNDMAVHPKVSR